MGGSFAVVWVAGFSGIRTHGALRQVRRFIGEGYRIAVDLDLAKFFDNARHDVLMARVARKVRDKQLLALIGRYLRAGVLIGESIQANGVGTPQGGPLSPLLANILLDDLDKELERRGRRFVRYADDLLILVKTPRAGERVMASVTHFLTRKLKLVVNTHKSRVAKISDCDFLGFTFRCTKLRWSERAFEDFRHQIRKLTGRSWGVLDDYRPVPELDHWFRRRVRMCYWKQWRDVRTKVRNLLAMGTSKRQAIMTGLSSKSYWHLSRTLAT